MTRASAKVGAPPSPKMLLGGRRGDLSVGEGNVRTGVVSQTGVPTWACGKMCCNGGELAQHFRDGPSTLTQASQERLWGCCWNRDPGVSLRILAVLSLPLGKSWKRCLALQGLFCSLLLMFAVVFGRGEHQNSFPSSEQAWWMRWPAS